ncbi:hypothetical protein [Stenotrophomonas maltophilia]|uniref:hypothetical protein n=1 Tax=Stenotrophomonas maltophilia TaxID=40324 RepID=UPI001D45B2D9|nr:hypothetical protein [Stenotrophomonas maltophilia]MBN5096029.1 hypothetical protein [Stenotrophomonas maltophilia]MDT3471091.1 hypothetical protein [Stenotrophomonas maltophilia]
MADSRKNLGERQLCVDTVLTDDYRVVQTLDVFGHASRRVADVAAMQMDQAIRDQLIRLGWTPPADGGPAHGR